MNVSEVKILIKNDDINTKVCVMETLSKLDISYFDAKELVKTIETNGEAIVLETSFEKAYFKYQDILLKSKLDFELNLV